MLSLLAVLKDGKAIETATVGREGVVGARAGLCLYKSLVRVVVQLPSGVTSQDPKRTPCDSKITELRASLSTSLRLDHKISCWYGYAPFQSARNKFKRDLRI